MISRSLPALFLFALEAINSPGLAAPNFVEKRTMVAPGVFLRSIEAGKSEGLPPIVFIPGWSTGAEIWSGQVQRFAERHRVIAFDPRSQGESSKTTSGNTPEQRAIDLHVLLARQNIKRPVLVGWSQAVQDIAAYVLRYGTQEIAGIVLVDAPVSDGSRAIADRPQQSANQFRLFGIYQSEQEAYLRGMFGAIISKPQPTGMVDQAVAVAMKTPPSIGIAMLVADMFTTDRTPALSKMDCPVLIVAAAGSPEVWRQKAEALAIRNGRYVEIDDTAHSVFLDQPDRFSTALSDFIGMLE
jgi:microsomal epoxide hydrolase